MKQKISKLINIRTTLLFVAACLCLFDGSHANASDILEQAYQAYELKDYSKARELYLKAAEQGEASAQYNLGNIYNNGEGVTKDYTKAIEWYLKAAEQGHVSAQRTLGALHFVGQGVTQDTTKAIEWFLKAAEHGDVSAQFALGQIYFSGIEVPEDYTKAIEWFLKAAEQGHEAALASLGALYWLGGGVAQDYTKAIDTFLKAAEQGNETAQYALGNFYVRGLGIPQDYSKAKDWYFKAAEQGNEQAKFALAELYVEKGVLSQNEFKRLVGQFSEDYFSEPITNDSLLDNYSLEQIYLLAHLDIGNWREKLITIDKEFKFKKEEALNRLSELVKFESGLELLSYLGNNYYFYNFTTKSEFQPILNKIIENLESSNLELKSMSADFLALYYDDGYLEPSNLELAEKYFKIAADAGSQFAQLRIGWNYLKSGNLNEAVRYLSLSSQSDKNTNLKLQALNDLAIAQTLLGENIQAVIQNYKKSANLASKSSYDFHYPAENLVRIYLSEKFGITKNFREAEKYSKLMKAEGHTGILFEALTAMKNDNQLKLIEFLEKYDNPASAKFEMANYFYGVNESEAFKNLIICSNISPDLDEQDNCESMVNLMRANMPGEMTYSLEQEARVIQNDLLLSLGNEKLNEQNKENDSKLGNSFALIISNSNYDNLNDLTSPKKDARVLSEVLKYNYGYNVELISNASRREIIKSFNKLKNNLKANDNLIVYYAGHGKSDGDTSFWLPREAFPDDDTDWIEDSTIERKIGQIKARNILVIADSCFSGNLTRGVDIVSVDTNEEVLNTYRNTVSRVAITSGGDEPILDKGPSGHSIFAAALIDYLKSQKKGFTAQELSLGISDRVLNTSIDYGMKQTPTYGQLFNAGHVGLDFVFTPK